MRHCANTQRVFRWPHTQSLNTARAQPRIAALPMNQYLAITALAERLQIKRSTLYAWAAQGSIPHVKLGQLLRFDLDEIEAWLHAHRREATPDPIPRLCQPGTDCVDALIAQAKREVYTSSRGKPDQDRAMRKGENRGSV